MEIKNLSRKKNRCLASSLSYLAGQTLTDKRTGDRYYHHRHDILFSRIFLPEDAPSYLNDLQTLCDEIERVETRKDARLGRMFICSLPNELDLDDQVQIIEQFIDDNFVSKDLCAVAAIHEGKNLNDPSKNNPHAHILVTTRTLSADGFSAKKAIDLNKRENVKAWRTHLARLQNAVLQEKHINASVHSKSFKARGKTDREPLPYLSPADYRKEQAGIRTATGDRRREIEQRNQERKKEKQMKREHDLERIRPR